MAETCSVESCDRGVTSKGMCSLHYQRLRTGVPFDLPEQKRNRVDPMVRFMRKVEVTDDCWLWTAAKSATGYGTFQDGRLHRAHRWLWERLNGPVPEGLELDHTCRVRHCVRPDHLEPTTHAENAARTIGHRKLKTHCKNGHEFTPENTYVGRRAGRAPARECKICRNEAARRHRGVPQSDAT